MPISPELRPRTVGEILDASFQLYRGRFATLLLACTILSLPTLVVAILISRPAGDAFSGYMESLIDYAKSSARDQGRPSEHTMDAMQRMIGSSLDVQLYSLLSAALQSFSRGGACIVGAIVVRAAILREPVPGPWSLVRASFRHLPAATLIQVFLTLVTVMSSMCCVILPLTVAFGAALAPACAILVVEDPGAGRPFFARTFAGFGGCVSRSLRLSLHAMTLVRGSFCISLILIFVSTVVGAASIAGFAFSSSFGVPFALQHYGEVLFLPVIGGGFALWYYDLRVRREGADFEAA